MAGKSRRPGRVAEEKIFPPKARKRRLVQRDEAGPVTEDARLTAAGGAWLKQLREAKGMSQAELCSALGMKYRYQISHIEIGRSHLAPGYFEAYAESVGVEPREFVKKLLSYYSPLVYALLLENE